MKQILVNTCEDSNILTQFYTNYFDIPTIANSGQVFRFNKVNKNRWEVFSKDKKLVIDDIKEENKIIFYCSLTDFKYWETYFDLKNNTYMNAKKEILNNDEFLKKAFQYGSGMRILKQDLFETIISFILSQRKSIPAIKTCIENFCKKYGEKKLDIFNNIYYAFPTIQNLKNIKLDDLNNLGFGYRSKYIYNFIMQLNNNPGFLENLKKKSYSQQKEQLLSIYGVGEKISDCILLFSLHNLNVLPKDVWIQRIIEEIYNNNFPYKKYQGLFQQYLFFYTINHKAEVKRSE